MVAGKLCYSSAFSDGLAVSKSQALSASPAEASHSKLWAVHLPRVVHLPSSPEQGHAKVEQGGCAQVHPVPTELLPPNRCVCL